MSLQEIKSVEQSYQNLDVYNRFTIQDNAELLKKLLPKGKLWDIMLPKEQQIKLYGIPSGEGFGDFNVVKPGGVFYNTTPVDFGIQRSLGPSDPPYEWASWLSNDSGIPPIPSDLYDVEITGPDASLFNYYFIQPPVVPSPGQAPVVFTFAPRNQVPDFQEYTAQAKINSNATNGPHYITLVGKVMRNLINMTPEPIDFGSIVNPINTDTMDILVTVWNPTPWDAVIDNCVIGGADSANFTCTTHLGGEIPAGGSKQFKVTLIGPYVYKTYTATIDVKIYNDPYTTEPLELILPGTITADVAFS